MRRRAAAAVLALAGCAGSDGSGDGGGAPVPRACTASRDCRSSERCADGFCVFGKRFGGDACSGTKDECLSGFCLAPEGICCDLGCRGACQSCREPDRLGACLPVPRGTRDPKCGPYLCDGTRSCPESCATDADCTAGATCASGQCR